MKKLAYNRQRTFRSFAALGLVLITAGLLVWRVWSLGQDIAVKYRTTNPTNFSGILASGQYSATRLPRGLYDVQLISAKGQADSYKLVKGHRIVNMLVSGSNVISIQGKVSVRPSQTADTMTAKKSVRLTNTQGILICGTDIRPGTYKVKFTDTKNGICQVEVMNGPGPTEIHDSGLATLTFKKNDRITITILQGADGSYTVEFLPS
ncbi:hypothetical protein [Lacticaseibacillus yichunensis]|uniref:Carboxypeptidase regulatory-like domain-containing protein n=1 Tax=Lacticaseibacillus yichunensis TaxID=2486015 RepID=A0ABW4CL32_9LACO|nr:hypothetical protein [Lacticaseibacillus yichunensis]